MPRRPRNYINSQFFHVITQGNNKEYIFDNDSDKFFYLNLDNDSDKFFYLNLVNKYREEFGIEIIAYCVMGNHVHLLIHTNKIEKLSLFMHKINGIYASYYNLNKKRVGYVFRERFKSEAITNDEYLFACIYYIHDNPVRAGICIKQSNYTYSSYREYFGKKRIVSSKLLKKIFREKTYLERKEECGVIYDCAIFFDVDIKDNVDYKRVYEDFLAEHQVTLSDIKQSKKLIRELAIEMKVKNGIPYRKIEKLIPVDRRKISKIVDKGDGAKCQKSENCF